MKVTVKPKKLFKNNLNIHACPDCPELRWKNLCYTKEHCDFPPTLKGHSRRCAAPVAQNNQSCA